MGAEENAGEAPRNRRSWTRTAMLAVAYVVIWVALWHAVDRLNQLAGVNLWVPCAGLTFAILLEYGWRSLPLPLLATLLAGWSHNGFGERWPYSLAASLAPLLGYLIAACILRHRPGGKRPGAWRFDDPRRVAAFLGAVMLGTLFAALAGAPLLQAAGLSPPMLSWLEMVGQEWMGAFIGIVTIAPLALIFIAPLARRFVRKEPLHLLKTVPSVESPSVRLGILQGGVSVMLIVALLWMPLPQWLDQSYPFMTLLLLPVLTWIAATHGVRGTTPTVLLYQLSITMLVMDFTLQELALQYQLAMAVIAASGLLTGAVSQARLVDIGRFRDLAEVSNDILWEFDNHGRLCDLR
ncbi:MAG: MASE1 domain-containing protein, partial [Candidatus Competibacteraceae bacterium]|nr:MASE1 domain-containing protein [Candidatus Competibacteraceae bacterium]